MENEEKTKDISLVLSIIRNYRSYGLQYVPQKLRGGVCLMASDGRKALFTCSPATQSGNVSPTKFLTWLHWQDSGKIVKSKDFGLFR